MKNTVCQRGDIHHLLALWSIGKKSIQEQEKHIKFAKVPATREISKDGKDRSVEVLLPRTRP